MTLPKYYGRKKPYTEIGIKRVPCFRCGKPSSTQWQICANGSRWLGVCKDCDVELNLLVLKYFGLEELIEYYKTKMKSKELAL